MRRQRGLWSAIIGPRVTRCREWRLTTRVFDCVAVGGVGIVDVEVQTTDGKAEVCIGVED